LSPKDPDLNTGTPAGDSTTAAYGNWLICDEVVTYLKLSKLDCRGYNVEECQVNCTFAVEYAEMKRSAAEIDGEYPTLAINSASSLTGALIHVGNFHGSDVINQRNSAILVPRSE
jgi:hypothetical protein